MAEKVWKVYLVECMDGSWYTGITSDIDKRMKMHASGKGSKYVRAKGFSKLIATKEFISKTSALKYECFVKGLSKNEKIELASKL